MDAGKNPSTPLSLVERGITGRKSCRQVEDRSKPQRLNWIGQLPQELLLKIICKVTHDDLKHLLLVSKSVSEVALIAKELHFSYTTPGVKPFYREVDDLEASHEVPRAPLRQWVAELRKNSDKFGSVKANLFNKPSGCVDWSG